MMMIYEGYCLVGCVANILEITAASIFRTENRCNKSSETFVNIYQTYQKTVIFIFITMKTSNATS
jgi:hypothetical protein